MRWRGRGLPPKTTAVNIAIALGRIKVRSKPLLKLVTDDIRTAVADLDTFSLGAVAWSCGVCNWPARRLFRAISDVATTPIGSSGAILVKDLDATSRLLWACAVLDLRSHAAPVLHGYVTHISEWQSADGVQCVVDGHTDHVMGDLAWAAGRLQAGELNISQFDALVTVFKAWAGNQAVDESGNISHDHMTVLCALAELRESVSELTKDFPAGMVPLAGLRGESLAASFHPTKLRSAVRVSDECQLVVHTVAISRISAPVLEHVFGIAGTLCVIKLTCPTHTCSSRLHLPTQLPAAMLVGCRIGPSTDQGHAHLAEIADLGPHETNGQRTCGKGCRT